MSDRPITFEVLNAYVDGELDASAMADVAHAVSEDSDLARQVAAISRLHSVLAESLDAPIYIHPRGAPPAMLGPFGERHLEAAIWGFQSDTALHALRLIVTGVFDEFPKLKIVLGHCGEGLPFWLDRIDRSFARSRRATEIHPQWRCKRLPSEYFLENFWNTSSGHNWGPAVRCTEEVVGEDRLMFAADYPYEDNKQQVDQAAKINVVTHT